MTHFYVALSGLIYFAYPYPGLHPGLLPVVPLGLYSAILFLKNLLLTRVAYNLIFLSRSALLITETELNVIAKLATIGLRKTPRIG